MIVATHLYKNRRSSRRAFPEYLIATGLGRIAIEFYRPNPEPALALSQPQWIGMVLVAAGGFMWARENHARST